MHGNRGTVVSDYAWAWALLTGAVGAGLVRWYDVRSERARARREFIVALRIVGSECRANAAAINLATQGRAETRVSDRGYTQVRTVLVASRVPRGIVEPLRRLAFGGVPELAQELREDIERGYRDILTCALTHSLPSHNTIPAGTDKTEVLLGNVAGRIEKMLKQLDE